MRSILATLALLAATPSLAQSDQGEQVRALYAEAQTEYDLGHFRKALEVFEATYKKKALPGLLFNIAQCHRKLGELKEAADTYRSFLIKADAQSREAARAKELLAEVEDAIRREQDAQAAPPHGTAPLLAPPVQQAAPARAAADWEFAPAPKAPAAAPVQAVMPAPEPLPSRSHKLSYVLGGLGAAALVGGAILGAHSMSQKSALTSTTHSGTAVSDLSHDYQDSAKLADLCFIATAALGLTAVLTW